MNLYQVDIGHPRFSSLYVVAEDFAEVEEIINKKILPLGIIPLNNKSVKSITLIAKCFIKDFVNGNLLFSPKLPDFCLKNL